MARALLMSQVGKDSSRVAASPPLLLAVHITWVCTVRERTNGMVSIFVILTILLLVAVDATITRRQRRSRQPHP